MCLLAIESSTQAASIAIKKNDKIIYLDYINIATSHSETIMPRIDTALKLLRIDKKDLTGITVSIGPGSFTGLRVGLATAKGIATGLRIPLISFNTLEVLASNVYGTEKHILSVLDARMNEAYVALFDKDLNIVIDTHCRPLDNVFDNIEVDYVSVGNVPTLNFTSLPHQNLLTAAAHFSLLDYKKMSLKFDEDYVYNLEPFYVRS